MTAVEQVAPGVLPEVANVHWRPRTSERELAGAERLWTASAIAHVVPFVAAGVGLVLLQPLAFPVAIMCLAHAWIIPALYARRGANVALPRRRAGDGPERAALGLLGDLTGHDARALHARTGLVLEPGRLGVWLVGEAGALLVRRGGRIVHCYCVRVAEPGLPSADRVAHLLLALREDEPGFATVANRAFAGGAWRVRRRLPKAMRPALAAARRARPLAGPA